MQWPDWLRSRGREDDVQTRGGDHMEKNAVKEFRNTKPWALNHTVFFSKAYLHAMQDDR